MTEQNLLAGYVYLVGAGPGNPGLITRLGYDLLMTCDAVIYDNLIPLELIVNLPPETEKHYVGKRTGKHSKKQPEINELLVTLALRGLSVVRLKGGDPSVFGRVGEETTYLSENKIPWVIIPGVTAASAGAAEVGFSLTDRRLASWTVLATGHEAVSGSPSVPWQSFGSLEGGTYVVYMGIGGIEAIVNKLLAGGMTPQTPVRIQQNISLGTSRSVSDTLVNITNRCQQDNITPPALVYIGGVSISTPPQSFNTRLPLSGKRILVTRPSGQTDSMCGRIRALGGEPIPHPTIRLSRFFDEEGWENFNELIANGGWLVFTSEAGVKFFFQQFFEQGYDIRAIGAVKIAVIGSGTASALEQWGIMPDLIPATVLVSSLASSLQNEPDIESEIIVRVRGNLGNEAIKDVLSAKGATVYPLTTYTNDHAVWEEHWANQLDEQVPDYIAFTSGSTIKGFLKNLGDEKALEIAQKSKIVCIGPVTAKIAENHGFQVTAIAQDYNVEGLVSAICSDVAES